MVDNKRKKRFLFGFLVLLLSIPMLQQNIKFANEGPIEGFYIETEKPIFSWSAWSNGTFQTFEEKYINEQFGFRPFFIRFYNQMYFSLYNQARANDVIIGKEQFLFAENYIKAYLGTDYMGDTIIKGKIDQLSQIRDTLAAKNIDLVVVLAPGKASFFNEYLPDTYVKEKDAITNYETIKTYLNKSNIHFVDFLDWFKQMKDTAAFPLFPKTGIHWSKYGEVLAADSLLKYISHLRNTPMPWIDTFGFDITSDVRSTDDDIERGMNIFTKIPDLEMGYFYTQIKKDSTLTYPKISVVGDSYYWGLFSLGLSEKGFNQGDFWYYFSEKHMTNGQPMKPVNDIDNFIEDLESNQVIILLSTDANLGNSFHGFMDRMHALYFPKTDS